MMDAIKQISVWVVAIIGALAALDGLFGGGERLIAIYSFVFPPKHDASINMGYRALGYRFDSYKKSGKSAFQLGTYLINSSDIPIYYKVEKAEYILDGHQNVDDDSNPLVGKILPSSTKALDFTPIYWSFDNPQVYDGEASVVIKYGRKRGRLGNTLTIHAKIRWEPHTDEVRRFAYHSYEDSDRQADPEIEFWDTRPR